MTPDEMQLLERRKAEFDQFFDELMPALVNFIEAMGIRPAHEVLRNAGSYLNYLGAALERLEISNQQDRTWLIVRVGYFIGEYFAQKHGGCWLVDENPGSQFFGRYVVGLFTKLTRSDFTIDPFLVSKNFVDSLAPRSLADLLKSIDSELTGQKSTTAATLQSD